MAAVNDKPQLEVDTVGQWESWLEANAGHDGVRLRLRKKAASVPGITYDEALDAALCFGWIDGQSGSIDEHYSSRAFTPRRARSLWSQRNRDLVEGLIEQGRMRPSGFAEIERAKSDGRWDAAYRQKGADVPEDLQAALDANPTAAAFFATLSGQNRFAILFRVGNVKRAETRARKIAEYVAMLDRGETIH